MLCPCLCVQMNWCEESLSHTATGWDASVKSRTIYDHSDVAPHNRMPNQSERTALWTRHRLDMPNTAPDAAACKDSEAFPVLSGVVICVGLPTDVHYSLSEIPPAGEESPPLAMNVAGQAAALHAGLGVRTTADPLWLFGIAWLRAFVCKLHIIGEMWRLTERCVTVAGGIARGARGCERRGACRAGPHVARPQDLRRARRVRQPG